MDGTGTVAAGVIGDWLCLVVNYWCDPHRAEDHRRPTVARYCKGQSSRDVADPRHREVHHAQSSDCGGARLAEGKKIRLCGTGIRHCLGSDY